jgi:hypothetical protein
MYQTGGREEGTAYSALLCMTYIWLPLFWGNPLLPTSGWRYFYPEDGCGMLPEKWWPYKK